jgi:hypothetical protein
MFVQILFLSLAYLLSLGTLTVVLSLARDTRTHTVQPIYIAVHMSVYLTTDSWTVSLLRHTISL